jgi:ankyrin repeat protein
LAAFRGHRDIVDFLLNNGASLMVHDLVTKRTPLHAAAGNGYVDCVQIMLRYLNVPSNIDVIDNQGRTPLMLAVTNGHINVVQVLVEYTSQIDSTDKHMCTALHRAVSSFTDLVVWVCSGFYNVYLK